MAIPGIIDFLTPEKHNDVVELLRKFGDGAIIVAGGTFVHGLEARGLLSEVTALINIGRLGLDRIDIAADAITLGATTTLAQLDEADFVQSDAAFGAINDALRYPPVQIMNVGTVGGCVCASAPLYDLPAAFLALDGQVTTLGADGSRKIALSDFFTGLFENRLASDEFLTAITLTRPGPETVSAFLKLETNANDLAIVNVAVRISVDDAGNCQDTRVFIGGGVGETYARAKSVEEKLNGNKPNDSLFELASAAAGTDFEAVSDHRGSAKYRDYMAKVLIRRALGRALARYS